MINKLKEIYEKYKEIILYLVFGVITTVVSLGVCYLTLKLGVLFESLRDDVGEPTELLDVIGSVTQWVSGVLVAFFVNKRFVFIGSETGKEATLKQLAVFSGGRVATLFIEIVINLGVIAGLDALGYKAPTLNLYVLSLALTSRVWAKVISSIVVVVSNYFISKLWVFKKKSNNNQ